MQKLTINMRLFSYTPFPPGEFPYSQVVNGVEYKFPAEGLDIYTQAMRVLKFRVANKVPKASIGEVLSDIDTFTCQRLGNDKRWCGENGKAAQVQKVQSRGCGGCGAVIK
jgi:hypothetical protein